jgi:hypothetical protein
VNPESNIARAFGTDSSTIFEGFATTLAVRQLGVAIDQAGQHCFIRQINPLRISRNVQLLANGRDLVADDHDLLVRQHCSGVRIDQSPSLDDRHLREGNHAERTHPGRDRHYREKNIFQGSPNLTRFCAAESRAK